MTIMPVNLSTLSQHGTEALVFQNLDNTFKKSSAENPKYDQIANTQCRRKQ